MKFPTIAMLCTAALFAAMPAMAQNNAMSGSAMSNSNAMSNGNAMSGTSATTDGKLNCQAMMAKADAMTMPIDLSKKSAAQTDMAAAKAAQAAGNEASCRTHVQAAMKNMM